MRLNTLFATSLITLAAVGLNAAEKKPWKDAYVSVGDIKIHYLDAGTSERSIVFLPGWTMNAEVWKEQITYFSARGYRVIAMDPRSQGLTTRTEEGNTYFQHAADLVAFLKALKLDRKQTTLVGWSAAIATLLEYASSPDTGQPEHLVFVDGGPLMRRETGYPSGLTPQEVRSVGMKFQEGRDKAADQFVRSLFKSPQSEILYKDMTEACLKTPPGTAVALLFDLYTGDRRPALSRIAAPTMMIMSENNRALGEYMQSKIDGSKLEVVPDSGSAIFLEKPQAFNQILENFLGNY